jgi:hypothetical protein
VNKEKGMKNGIIGTHLATGMPVELVLNYKEMQLAMDKNAETINKSWEMMNDAVLERTGTEIIGQIEIEHIVVDGVKKVFH